MSHASPLLILGVIAPLVIILAVLAVVGWRYQQRRRRRNDLLEAMQRSRFSRKR